MSESSTRAALALIEVMNDASTFIDARRDEVEPLDTQRLRITRRLLIDLAEYERVLKNVATEFSEVSSRALFGGLPSAGVGLPLPLWLSSPNEYAYRILESSVSGARVLWPDELDLVFKSLRRELQSTGTSSSEQSMFLARHPPVAVTVPKDADDLLTIEIESLYVREAPAKTPWGAPADLLLGLVGRRSLVARPVDIPWLSPMYANRSLLSVQAPSDLVCATEGALPHLSRSNRHFVQAWRSTTDSDQMLRNQARHVGVPVFYGLSMLNTVGLMAWMAAFVSFLVLGSAAFAVAFSSLADASAVADARIGASLIIATGALLPRVLQSARSGFARIVIEEPLRVMVWVFHVAGLNAAALLLLATSVPYVALMLLALAVAMAVLTFGLLRIRRECEDIYTSEGART